MQYLEMNNHDVFENLATEEYIFHNLTEDSYLLLYQNDASLVVGKYQNVYQEINVPAVEAAGIKVARRISGGGTVFHDIGNLNYAFITSTKTSGPPCYDDFLTPVIDALQSLGTDARKRNICDIAIGDEKISGSAQTIHGNRVLHHGTLLFQSDMEQLHDYLKVTDATIESKAVASVSSPVTNISNHMRENNMSIVEFKSALRDQLSRQNDTVYTLSAKDKQAIQKLRDEKYNTWEWNWGKSPKFTLRRDNVTLLVTHGIITECTASFLPKEAITALIGQRYGYQNLTNLLSPYLGDETKRWLPYLF
ncbi:MAG: biotin/lipoate A/B protein ligase family protein [Roseburia sp.]